MCLQTEDTLVKARGIIDFYEEMKSRVANLNRSRYAIRSLDWILERPIFHSAYFATEEDIFQRRARQILDAFFEGDLLRLVSASSGRRTAILTFRELMNIVEGGKVI